MKNLVRGFTLRGYYWAGEKDGDAIDATGSKEEHKMIQEVSDINIVTT